MTIGLCTDSHAQLPVELAASYGIEVVPLTLRIDDQEYLDGVDLDADGFYAMFDGHRRPVVATVQPSPGQFALAYEALLARGCTEILSIHSPSSVSGTLNSARLAAHQMDVPVRLVDAGIAGFGVGCCVWAASDAVMRGATFEVAALAAESLSPSIGVTCLIDPVDPVDPVDSVDSVASSSPDGHTLPAVVAEGIPVFALSGGEMRVIERVGTMADAIILMASSAIGWGHRLHVGIGAASRAAFPLADALADSIGEAASVRQVMRYRIGASTGGHMGPGAVACFTFPSGT